MRREPGRQSNRTQEEPAKRSYREERWYYDRSLRERGYAWDEEPERSRRDRSREDRRPLQKRADVRSGRQTGFEREQIRKQELRNKKKKQKKAGRFFKGLLCFILILVIALALIWFVPGWKASVFKAVLSSPLGPAVGRLFIGQNYDRYVWDSDFDESKLIINEGASVPKGNTTIALFGVDARAEDLDIGTMSDSIVVVNVDENGGIKMASLFRDTYLLSHTQDGQDVISKANSAYFRGGPLGAVNMLNENFDLAISDYVVVNFWGMANIVDLMGGLRLKVTEEERKALNYHMYEQNLYGNTEYIPLETSGESVLLTGDQATAFCRLRKVTFDSPVDGITYTDDYGRAARQRYVLMELMAQMKAQGMIRLLQLSNDLFKANGGDRKFIQSSMDTSELIRLFAKASDMNIVGNAGFPDLDHQYNAVLDSGDSVVADTLEENVTLMHKFLYGTEDYEPTQALVNVAERIRAEVARQGY